MKARRTVGAIGMSAVLLFTGALPVWADASPAQPTGASNTVVEGSGQKDTTPAKAKISKEEALKKAKAMVTIPTDYKLTNTNFNSDAWSTENGSWQFNFEKTLNNRTYGNINVVIDAETGKLITFNRFNNDPDKQVVYPPKVDYSAAKELAYSLLNKMNPEEAASTLYDSTQDENFIQPLQGDFSYNFRFDRAVNGVRYPTDSISFQIDSNGALIGYYYGWHTSSKFEPLKTSITPENALATYKKVSKPYLQYIQTTTKDHKAKIALSYTLYTYPLDAVTGSLVTDWAWNPSEWKPLTEKPLAAMPAKGQNLTEAEAIAAAKKLLPLPATAVLESANYSEYQDMYMGDGVRKVWQMSWTNGKDKDITRYNASVNADNGTITNYNEDSYGIYLPLSKEEAAKALDDAKLTKAVEDFVKKALPQYSHQLALEKSMNATYLAKANEGTNRITYYNLYRLINGIPTEMDNVSVGIDRTSGKILNLYANINPLEYPSAKPTTIDAGKALDLLLTPYHLDLQYMDVATTDSSIAWKDRQPAKLVYMPLMTNYDNVYLDAESGKWIKRETGEETQLGKSTATDISGHPAQKELQLLIDYKALDVKDGKVNPEQIVTRGEFIKILVIALNGGNYYPQYSSSRANTYKDVLNTSAYFAYVEAAVDAGILDRSSESLNPDGKMTREEMAQLLVRALGFDKLAAKSDLFNLNVKDSDQIKLKGQAAIVLSLGIMEKTADGNFLPAGEVTRATAAVTFYKFLQARPAMQSSPLRNIYY
ncbi:S-layer homology domain-containing protein [Gorillibacterium timonense]|uniref:S-layer homology domain-containing protein n=1 Tax=Gorillibacterium timonense TaxID=1689269 RepID=UPI00071C7E7F|nr:S-layer homology domain-containing protein [Gorillibacterium timonense]